MSDQNDHNSNTQLALISESAKEILNATGWMKENGYHEDAIAHIEAHANTTQSLLSGINSLVVAMQNDIEYQERQRLSTESDLASRIEELNTLENAVVKGHGHPLVDDLAQRIEQDVYNEIEEDNDDDYAYEQVYEAYSEEITGNHIKGTKNTSLAEAVLDYLRGGDLPVYSWNEVTCEQLSAFFRALADKVDREAAEYRKPLPAKPRAEYQPTFVIDEEDEEIDEGEVAE